MKILIAIDAPGAGSGWGRKEQADRTEIARMVTLLASRIELGQSGGSITGDGGASLHWKIEQSPEAPAEGEAA